MFVAKKGGGLPLFIEGLTRCKFQLHGRCFVPNMLLKPAQFYEVQGRFSVELKEG